MRVSRKLVIVLISLVVLASLASTALAESVTAYVPCGPVQGVQVAFRAQVGYTATVKYQSTTGYYVYHNVPVTGGIVGQVVTVYDAVARPGGGGNWYSVTVTTPTHIAEIVSARCING